jgi:Ni,Fe-hydrogenase III large subunit
MESIAIKNNQRLSFAEIPILPYARFLEMNTGYAAMPEYHCVQYYCIPEGAQLRLICCMANDLVGDIHLSSSKVSPTEMLPSFSAQRQVFHLFEREIHENSGLSYTDHPWLKPARYAENRHSTRETIANYPFYRMASEELHEVGVGPIHAGIIEPGHFRFICSGEKILHLEIQLGFQHRGIEALFLQKQKLLQRTLLAESIAGDTVAGHTTAFVNLWENLSGFQASEHLQYTRTMALELERIAIHTGDLSALCTDIAYQLGSSVFGRLRTPVINYFQRWCGNRLAKGLIRAGGGHFPFTEETKSALILMLGGFEPDFNEMCDGLFNLTSVLSRFEKTGIVTMEQVAEIGAVGLSARMSGIARDIRATHPHDLYQGMQHKAVTKRHGDVYSRAQIRKEEVRQSIDMIRSMLEHLPGEPLQPPLNLNPLPDSFCLSLVEGWRGEICHCAITDSQGQLMHYKVKDPSLHNWMALALAVRNNEISDFPICNKSFNLSYCGFDL